MEGPYPHPCPAPQWRVHYTPSLLCYLQEVSPSPLYLPLHGESRKPHPTLSMEVPIPPRPSPSVEDPHCSTLPPPLRVPYPPTLPPPWMVLYLPCPGPSMDGPLSPLLCTIHAGSPITPPGPLHGRSSVPSALSAQGLPYPPVLSLPWRVSCYPALCRHSQVSLEPVLQPLVFMSPASGLHAQVSVPGARLTVFICLNPTCALKTHLKYDFKCPITAPPLKITNQMAPFLCLQPPWL